MTLERLSLRNFRCFSSVDLNLSPSRNLIVGANASGKTSLLEAIYFLSRGRSFRTTQQLSLVRDSETSFQIIGQANNTILGVERDSDGIRARLAGAPAPSRAAMTETLPVQVIDAQSHLLIEGGPSHRRRFLDWGAFHVEHRFWSAWRRYNRCLRQRNALLRTKADRRLLESWTAEMVDSGNALNYFRRTYFERWYPTALSLATRMLNDSTVQLSYHRGWPKQQTLEESITQSMDRDRKASMTQVGPHRAGFSIRMGESLARVRISRGQQKALAAAFLLAQALLYRKVQDQPCTLLIDDAAAELDRTHLHRFVDVLKDIETQTIMTAISFDTLPQSNDETIARFHVKQSRIELVV